MSSFTDSGPIPFTPYIETNPVDAYLRVGMYKEQMLEEGIQKVQTSIDTLSGLPILKDNDKLYLQSKLGELKGGITKNLSGDFSDSRIVNQIAGAAKTIYTDPVIQNAVQGTAAYKKGLADAEADRKAGKNNLANETVFNDQVQAWLNDGVTGSKYSQYFTGYTPYTDKIDMFLKYWKETNPSDAFEGDMTRLNAKGEREINPVIFKGKSAAQVKAVWDLVKSNANVQQQLQIDGQFSFRGQEAPQIYQALGEQTKATIDKNNQLILSLMAKAATGDEEAKADIQSLKDINKEAEASLSSYAEALKTNPDAVKSALVSQQTLSSLVGAYSYKTLEKNPLWETSFQMSKWKREMEEWDITNARENQKFEWQKYMDINKFNLETEKERKKNELTGGIKTPSALSPEEVVKNEFTARKDVENAQTVYTQSMRELAYNLAVAGGDKPPYYKDEQTQTWEPNVGPGKDYPDVAYADGVAKTYFDQVAQASGVGLLLKKDKNLNDLYVKAQGHYDNLQNSKKIVEEVETAFLPEINKLVKEISSKTNVNAQAAGDFTRAYIVKNKLEGWQAIEAGLKQQYGNDWETGMQIGDETVGYGEDITFKPQALKQSYKKASEILSKNPQLANIVKAKELAYQERQKVPVGFSVTTPSSENETARSTYAAIVGSVTSLNPESNKGEYKNFEEMLYGKSDVVKQNTYSRYLNPITKEGFLTISNGNDKVSIKIPEAEYLRYFPNESQYSAFREKFQTKINLNRGMYTGNEYTNAYQAYQTPDSKYIVKYHVIATGNGNYKLRWWVAEPDETSPSKIKMLIDGEVMGENNGLNQEMSEEAIVAATKKLEEKQWIELNLAMKRKPQ